MFVKNPPGEHYWQMFVLDASKEDPLDTALSLSTVYDDFDEKLLNEHDPYKSNFKSNIKVNTFVYRGGYCCRANTIANYNEMNRLVGVVVNR